jgi:hypothetical protein
MTNNKQQTPVEWLAEQIEILHYDYWAEHISKDEKNQRLKQLKEKAKEMDKEQKIRDFTDGYLYRGEQLSPWLIDKWYNETYGGGEQ